MLSLPLPVTLAALAVLVVLHSIRKDRGETSPLIYFAICGVILKINYDIGPILLTLSLVFGCFLFFVATWIFNPKSIHIKPLPFMLISCAAIILAIQGWMSPVNQDAQQQDEKNVSSDSNIVKIIDPLGIYSPDDLSKLRSRIETNAELYNEYFQVSLDALLILWILPMFFWTGDWLKNIAKKIGSEPAFRISFGAIIITAPVLYVISEARFDLMFFFQSLLFILFFIFIVNFFFFIFSFGAILQSLSTKHHNKKIISNAFFDVLLIILFISFPHIYFIMLSLMREAITVGAISFAFIDEPLIGSLKSFYFHLLNPYYDKDFHKPFTWLSFMCSVLSVLTVSAGINEATEILVNEKIVWDWDRAEERRVVHPNEREQWQNKFDSNAENENLLNAMYESDIGRRTMLMTLDKLHRSPLLRSIFIKKNAKDKNSIYDV